MILNYSVPSEYKIQHAKENDIPLLDAIEAAAGTIFPHGSIPENILAERVPYDIFVDAINQGNLLVALGSDQTPVGFAFWQNVEGSALLALIEVHPLHGQKGIGRALVLQIMNQVMKAGFQHLYLTTFANIPWNAPFYQKIGFVLLGEEEQPDFIKDILIEERGKGLSNRVAMRYSIQSA